MPYCLVVNCVTDSKRKSKEKEKDYQWLQLPDESTPQSKKLRNRWLEVLNRDFQPSEHARICSRHFLDTDFLPDSENLNAKKEPKKKKKLKPNAVPSLFLKNAKLVKGRPTKNSNNEDFEKAAEASTSFGNDIEIRENYQNESFKNDSSEALTEYDNEEKKEPTAMDYLRQFISDEESDTEMPELESKNNEQKEIINHDHMCLWVPPQEPKPKVKICHLFPVSY